MEEQISMQAMQIWRKIQKQIHRIIQSVIGFNNFCEYDDYLMDAYEACVKGVKHFNEYREDITSEFEDEMRREVKIFVSSSPVRVMTMSMLPALTSFSKA